MKIIIPMAGMGTRMRPHTLTIPKPLITLAGKTIVQRLIEGLSQICNKPITEIAFVIGDFGEDAENLLKEIAKNAGAEAKIYYQNEALGTAHAVYCAEKSLSGEVIVAFADTLFFANTQISENAENIIFVQKVENPEQYGVVVTDNNDKILKFVEKPKTKISDLAIVGIYYFKNAEKLRNELENIINNGIKKDGEFQLTTALENMKNAGTIFNSSCIDGWLDCGNKNVTLNTHKELLDKKIENTYLAHSAKIINSTIIQPCYIAENSVIENSVVGPFVSIHHDCKILNSVIDNSIVQSHANITNANISNSMIGNKATIIVRKTELSVGDFNQIEI